MLNIDDTIDLHLATIKLYANARRRALKDHQESKPAGYLMPARHYVTGEIVMALRAVDPLRAAECFLKYAQDRNARMMNVKRFKASLALAQSSGNQTP